jgi:hypothetical protein
LLVSRFVFGSSNQSSIQASDNTTITAHKPPCTYGNCPNHTKAHSFKKQADLCNKMSHQTNPNEAAAVILAAAHVELSLATTQKLSATIFIGDTRATCHMRYFTLCMIKLAPCQTTVTVGNSETTYSQARGSLKHTVHFTVDISFSIIIFTNVHYAADLWLNLIFIIKRNSTQKCRTW